MEGSKRLPPPAPFLSKGRVGRKGEISSHWPRADAAALRRKERGTKSHRFSLIVKGKGRGSFPLFPPGRRHPSPPSPPRPAGIKSEQPGPAGSCLKAATVVWLRRGEPRTRSGAHDAGFGQCSGALEPLPQTQPPWEK